jgi:hypothetical protein
MRLKGVLRLALDYHAPLLICPTTFADSTKSLLIVQVTADQLWGEIFGTLPRCAALGLRANRNRWILDSSWKSRPRIDAIEWWVQTNSKWGDADVSRDDLYKVLDAAKTPGLSPKNKLARTLGEWTKSVDPRSKSAALGTGSAFPTRGNSADTHTEGSRDHTIGTALGF